MEKGSLQPLEERWLLWSWWASWFVSRGGANIVPLVSLLSSRGRCSAQVEGRRSTARGQAGVLGMLWG